MKPHGLYVTPTDFVRFAEPRQSLSDHIATRDRSPDFFALGMYLPNPDPILKKQGKTISVYSDLRSDAHVGGCIRRRKAAVLGLEWRVEREKASARSTKLCQDVLQNLNMSRLLHECLEAVLYGWQPLEVLWSAPGAGPRVPLQVLAKPVHWFHFDADAQLRFKTREQPLFGELQMPRKFLLPAQEASYANPYGFADLSMCFWPTVFKRGGLKFWVTFTEKFGTPWVVGKTPRGTPGPEQDKLLDQLEAMVQDAVAVIPDDASVEIKEAAGKGSSADLYERLLMYCRSEIAIALLGQNQSTEASANKASATAGLEVAKDIRNGDARLCEATINELLRWIVDSNEGEGAPAPKFELFEQEEVDEVQAKRDKLLSDAGLRFTPAYWTRVYGLEEGDIDLTPPPAPNAAIAGNAATTAATITPDPAQALAKPGDASFAESTATTATSNPLAPLADTMATAGDTVLSTWMTHIASLVNSADTPADLTDALLHSYGDLPTEQLTELMAMAFAAAELKGMDAVRTEAADVYAPRSSSFAEATLPAPSPTPDPRLDQISADIASLQSSVDVLAAKEAFVIHNTIQVPEQAAPVVNTTVHVPEQAAPVVSVHAPVTVQPSDVTVNNVHPARAVQTVQRDANDEIVSTTTTYEA